MKHKTPDFNCIENVAGYFLCTERKLYEIPHLLRTMVVT